MVEHFAVEVMRPAGRVLDAMPDPAQVVAPESVLWEVFDRYRELGVDAADLASAGLPPDARGHAASPGR